MAGDGDEKDLVDAVELVFGISFEEEELGAMLSVGDMYRAVLTRPEAYENGGIKCRTAMMFYRLRPVFAEMKDSIGRVEPKTLLTDFSPKQFRPSMSANGLNSGNVVQFPAGPRIFAAFIAGIVSLIIGYGMSFSVAYWVGGLSLAVGCFSFYIAKWRWRPGLETVGDVARALVPFHHPELTREGGRCDKDEIWLALRAVISDVLGLSDERRISPETTFFRQKKTMRTA